MMRMSSTVPGWGTLLAMVLALVLAGCGGGASVTTTSSGGQLGGSGGVGNTPSGVCATTNEQYQGYPGRASAANVAPIYMDNCVTNQKGSAFAAASNIPYVSVYLCSPSGTTCAWIDHIQLDTGSVGLRIVAAAIPAPLLGALTPVQNPSTGGFNVGECYPFVLSYFWGGLRNAVVRFGGTPAQNGQWSGSVQGQTVVQVLNDAAVPASAPASCASAAGSSSLQEKTAGDIGANGVLGVGMANYDFPSAAIYYQCASATDATTCTQLGTVTTSQAVGNPVAASGNNGHSIYLDPAAAIRARQVIYNSYGVTLADGSTLTNASSVAGYLTFGIPAGGAGAPASIFTADASSQRISANVAGVNLPSSSTNSGGAFFDSGSNAYFYDQGTFGSAIPLNTCTNNVFACESPAGSASAVSRPMQLGNFGQSPSTAVTGGLTFYDADYLFTHYVYSPVYEGLVSIQATPPGGTNPFQGQFDAGLPFFLGRTVWLGVCGSTTPCTTAYYGL